ncbi:MAG: macrolide ABC transporter ATP-binding protein [Candidatus Staskawiczbacteria bacterium RIFCSPHIGHO2_02_FULL_34_9]|uniref:Macrolide ABC transporter ATP-binding protein n=1 Tax=Candidatus Staskawiczbacteria bacterium RIFCSPHIGHO2_02_FULL_34_9 TaxID=1802206 RepID=A0A1G2I1G2_9BACT|nr:MAG: macrolide ABC transporter ATP-binding protein [Candidatus Staskawiczbacteria bacterium RIFCSPHIGHO2_02_FULL_34_9]
MDLIKVEKLSKDYVNEDVVTHVLHDINFKIEKGEFVAIMGPSGSGKSTLMHILGFLDRPTNGSYKFEGKDTDQFDDNYLAKLRNEKIGFVFQSFNLLQRTTVLDNVKLPLFYSMHKNEDKMARDALEAVGLSHRLNYFTNQISGGEKQRVAIARALVTDPAVIFADEPTGNLDSKSGNAIMSILQKLNDEGHTIILVTHEQDTANHAKRIVKVKDGSIISDEKVKDRVFAKDNGGLIK